jgi:hypothetical protein
VKDATCELAFQFVKAGTTDLAALPTSADVASKSVDVLQTQYVDPSQRKQGLARFPRIMARIRPLMATANAGQIRMVRG